MPHRCVRTHKRIESDGTVEPFSARLARKEDSSKTIMAASTELSKTVHEVLKDRRQYCIYGIAAGLVRRRNLGKPKTDTHQQSA